MNDGVKSITLTMAAPDGGFWSLTVRQKAAWVPLSAKDVGKSFGPSKLTQVDYAGEDFAFAHPINEVQA